MPILTRLSSEPHELHHKNIWLSMGEHAMGLRDSAAQLAIKSWRQGRIDFFKSHDTSGVFWMHSLCCYWAFSISNVINNLNFSIIGMLVLWGGILHSHHFLFQSCNNPGFLISMADKEPTGVPRPHGCL